MLKVLHKSCGNEKGFTLVELMVVIVIIGVLVAIAVPIYNSVTAGARESAYEANERILKGAAAMYFAENGPVDGSITKDTNHLDPYLESWPENPLGTGDFVVTINEDGNITVVTESVEDNN